jgi:hypothetical protein
MFMMTEHFLSDVIEEYEEHPVSATDDDGGGTWYPSQAYSSLKLNHDFHSSFAYKKEKSSIIIERTAVY